MRSVLSGMTSLTSQHRSVPARTEVCYLLRKYLPQAEQRMIPTKITAFLRMTPCNLAGIYGRFRGSPAVSMFRVRDEGSTFPLKRRWILPNYMTSNSRLLWSSGLLISRYCCICLVVYIIYINDARSSKYQMTDICWLNMQKGFSGE